MRLTAYLFVFSSLVSAWCPANSDEVDDLCGSVPAVTKKAMNGMDKDGAVSFVENNRSLMNLKIVWWDGDTPASCSRVFVTAIRKVKNEDNGKVEVGYFRGKSRIWDFSPNETSGNGTIKNGKLSVKWSYGTVEVTQTDEGSLEALWIGGSRALVPGRKKGRVVEVFDPLK